MYIPHNLLFLSVIPMLQPKCVFLVFLMYAIYDGFIHKTL